MTVFDAAQESRLAALKATRDKLAAAIDDAPVSLLPQVTGQFRAVLADIAEIEGAGAEKKETGLSDFEKRLRERESGSKASRSSKVR